MSTLVMTTRSFKIFLEWQNGRKNKNSAFHHFHIDRNAPCFPPTPLPHQKKKLMAQPLSYCLRFLLGRL